MMNTEQELNAAVEYHDNYSTKIDKALGEPRIGGDLLTCHLVEIARLRNFYAEFKRNAETPLPDCCLDIVCRGCKELGTACGKCLRCREDA